MHQKVNGFALPLQHQRRYYVEIVKDGTLSKTTF